MDSNKQNGEHDSMQGIETNDGTSDKHEPVNETVNVSIF